MTSSDSTLVDRVQSFVSENKRVILFGTAAVIAAGGLAYYASTSRTADGSGDVEKGERRSKKKKNGKGKKSVKDADGPILEERALPTAGAVAESPEAIAAMSVAERNTVASQLKQQGNTAYSERRFEAAAGLYTRAIAITAKPEAVFYSNRAACYMNFPKPEYEKAVCDCDEALKLDIMYVKALNRRASALEHLGRLEESLRDFTAVTILDKFKNEAASTAVERLIKALSVPKAQEMFNSRGPKLPPHTFMDAYFGAFRSRPLPTLPEEPSTGDNTFLLAAQALEARDYPHAVTLINEALEQGVSYPAGLAEAYNIRGSCGGDSQGAQEDLEASIAALPGYTQSWVKIASVYMEQGDAMKAFEAFDKATQHDANDPDIFYHRGQVLFIMSEFKQAAENYLQAISLDNNFVFSQIQLAVAQYKGGNISNSMATFRRALKAFPNRSEPHNYYGELLLDQQKFADAIERFDRAIEIERTKKPPMNVLPMVNKGLTLFQWQQDIDGAERMITEALEHDPECEAAVATLAQISLQQGKIETAVKMFRRQTELARSEPDLVNALNFLYAADAQIAFMNNYPDLAREFMQMPPGAQPMPVQVAEPSIPSTSESMPSPAPPHTS